MESKARHRQEQIEIEEKRQREIYLNGGLVDCVNSGCQGQVCAFAQKKWQRITITLENFPQGTSETSYLCKTCFSHQQSIRRKHQQTQPKPQPQESRVENSSRIQATCHYFPQPSGHYGKTNSYGNQHHTPSCHNGPGFGAQHLLPR